MASEEKVAELGQHFDNLATVVSKALGGASDEDDDDVQEIGSWAELTSAFQTLGGHIGN
ncbi:hypothetical protein [Mesorhizobium sp. WSM2239]|uniref:Uncharacterized protein n=2 Tax=unclassified Mesorhizobium TaxID=325217 RepID=A0AAU8DI31_9HYPH